MRVLGVDPSLTGMGWAVFDNGKLVHAGLVKSDKPYKHAADLGKIAQNLAAALGYADAVDALVVEIPQVYATGKGDQNDLIAVSIVAGAVINHFGETEDIVTVLPRQWKGQVPKDIHNGRVMAKLSPAEIRVVEDSTTKSKRHNVIDAVGLCQWYLSTK